MKSFSLRLIAFCACCVLVLVFLFGGSNPAVCDADVTVKNTSGAKLYYPCGIKEPTPATTLMSGHAASHWVLAWLAERMAENGFVVLAMTPTDRLGKNPVFRDAHLAGVERLEELNNTSGVLHNKIDLNKLQLCGHSKGGGGALMAANILGTRIKSTIAMAPWHDNFSQLEGIKSSTLIQAGGKDPYVTHKMARGEYDLLPKEIDKAFFEYETAHHFSWGVLNLRKNREAIGEDVVAWMKFYLKSDQAQLSKLLDSSRKPTNDWHEAFSKHRTVMQM